MLQYSERKISSLRPYARNARTHSKKQIKQIAASIQRFGFTNPVLISDDGEIIAGHGRVRAVKLLGWDSVPTLALSNLSPDEIRAYVLADNKLALNAGWEREILAIELQALIDLEFDVEIAGFGTSERVVWGNQPVAAISAASVAPSSRSSKAMTAAALVWRGDFAAGSDAAFSTSPMSMAARPASVANTP